jgi:hypothetical protein
VNAALRPAGWKDDMKGRRETTTCEVWSLPLGVFRSIREIATVRRTKIALGQGGQASLCNLRGEQPT